MEVLPVQVSAYRPRLAESEPNKIRADRRLKYIPLPNGGVRRELYDLAGRLRESEDPGGKRLFFRYNADGHLTEVHDRDSILASYSFASGGREMSARTARTETLIRVDSSRRPREIIVRVDNFEWTAGFEWSDRGALTAIRYPGTSENLILARNGSSIEWRCGRRVHLTGEANVRTGFSRLTYSNGAAVLEELAGGRRPRLNRIAHFDASGAAIGDYPFEYDDDGRITGAGEEQFRYDDAGRLIRSRTGRERCYQYDDVGRLAEVQPGARFTYADGPMILSAETETGRASFEYDSAGRRIRKETEEGVTRYSFDGFGQICSIELPDGRIIEYVYDGFGRLVSRQSDAERVYYITDLQGHRLADADDSGRIIRSYLWTGAQCGACIDGTIDHAISRTFHRAHSGRLTAIGDASGCLTTVDASEPFGADAPIQEGLPAYASLFGDPATGLLHAGSRWLDPATAQFLSADTWFGRDAASMAPPSMRKYARAAPGGPGRDISAEAAYNWCAHEPVNRSDPNGHSWYGLILTGISGLIWALQLTTVSIELEMFNIVAEAIQWFPLVRPAWPPHSGPVTGWDKYKRTSIFNLSAPVYSNRLNVPLAFVLNGFLTNSGGRVWTMGNVIWGSGSELRGLEKSSKRDLLVCGNASTYIAFSQETAADRFRARNTLAAGTAAVDAAGLQLSGITFTAPAGAALTDVFEIDDWISVRKSGDASTETPRRITAVGATTMDLFPALPAPLPGSAVEIARLDSALVKIERENDLIGRTITYVRGTSIHFAQQIPEGFPVDTLKVEEFMPDGKRNRVTADNQTEFYVIRLAAAADQAPFAASDFLRIRSGSTYFASALKRKRAALDLVLATPLPTPAAPNSYPKIEVVKMDGAGAAVPNQTAAGDHVNVGNVVDLRKFDGLAIQNTGAATVTIERRIVMSMLMDCQVVALDAGLHDAPVTVEQMNLDASKQAGGTNTTSQVVTTAAGKAKQFSTGDWVRVRKALSTDSVTMITAVDSTANKITLRDALPAAAFPNGTAVTVTLLAAGKKFESENPIAPGDHVKVKSDSPGDLHQNDIIRLTLKSDSAVAAARVITAAPVVVAVVDSALPATHTANLTVNRFTPAAATLHGDASAPKVQLRFTVQGAPAAAAAAAAKFALNKPIFLTMSRTLVQREYEEAWGSVIEVTGADIFLADPVDHLLTSEVDIVSIISTAKTTDGATLDEAKVLVPAAVLATKTDDADLQPLTHREAVANHEMRHVFQYACWGPFFHSMPLPWLVSLGFSFSDLDESASEISRHFSVGAIDSAIAGIVWGIGKAANKLPSQADVTGTVGGDLESITFAAGVTGDQMNAFTDGAPISVSKDGFSAISTVDHLDTAARKINLRVKLNGGKFASGDNVGVHVSAFEKIRKVISTTIGLNLDEAWSSRIPTTWGRVLSKFINRDSWFPLLGIYWLSFFRAGLDQRRIPLEQDAAFNSGDLYSSLAIATPNEIFVGQFSAIYGFIQHRSYSPTGDVASGLSFRSEALELLTVELPGGVGPEKVAGAIPAAVGGQIRFRENWYIPMNEKVENVIGALFAASQDGDYTLHVPGELGPDEDVVFQGAAPLDFLKMKKIKVKPLVVTFQAEAPAFKTSVPSTQPIFETEEVRIKIDGDSTATYKIAYQPGAPATPTAINGLRFTAPKLPGAAAVPHKLQISAAYTEAHPIFHRLAQAGNVRLTADQRTNVCQELIINVNPITAPAIPAVAAGKSVKFDTPIKPSKNAVVTSPLPAGAVNPARVVLGNGRPAHHTFFAPNKVKGAVDVKFKLTFGTAPNEKTVEVTVHVTP